MSKAKTIRIYIPRAPRSRKSDQSRFERNPAWSYTRLAQEFDAMRAELARVSLVALKSELRWDDIRLNTLALANDGVQLDAGTV